MTDQVNLPLRLDEEDEENKPGMGDALIHPFAKIFAESRSILCSEVVSDKLARSVLTQAIALEHQDPSAPIWVFVNSPGGSADSGFAIYDILRFVKPPVRTIVSGLCASAAVTIFLSGDEGHRYTLPNSRFLLHQPSTVSRGDASDIEITAKEILRLKTRYNQIVCDVTGKDLEEVEKDADRDFWLDAEGALDYGLVDKIVTERGELE